MNSSNEVRRWSFLKLHMQTIPEELKNSKCCLKCKLVDVEYTTKEIKVGTGGVTKEIYKCKKCSGYITSYNEIMSSGKSFIYLVLLLCVALHIVGALRSLNINHLFIADTIVCLFFGLIWFHNNSQQKKLENFLQQHVENKS